MDGGSVSIADMFLSISQYTRGRLECYLEATGYGDVPIRILPLAEDRLPTPPRMAASGQDAALIQAYPKAHELEGPSREFTELFYRPSVIWVGTFEARKNIWQIATARKSLADAGYHNLPRLLFVGHANYMPRDFKDFMKGTGGCNGHVSVVSDLSDNKLDLLYRKCLFTVQASLAEGWGLPVGESLAYGKTALVARSSSLPEVGGDMVVYCDPEDIDSIATGGQALLDIAVRRRLEDRIRSSSLRRWRDVAVNLTQVVGEDSPMVTAAPNEGQLEDGS